MIQKTRHGLICPGRVGMRWSDHWGLVNDTYFMTACLTTEAWKNLSTSGRCSIYSFWRLPSNPHALVAYTYQQSHGGGLGRRS